MCCVHSEQFIGFNGFLVWFHYYSTRHFFIRKTKFISKELCVLRIFFFAPWLYSCLEFTSQPFHFSLKMSKQDHKHFSAFYGFVFIFEIISKHHCKTALSVKAISTAATTKVKHCFEFYYSIWIFFVFLNIERKATIRSLEIIVMFNCLKLLLKLGGNLNIT